MYYHPGCLFGLVKLVLISIILYLILVAVFPALVFGLAAIAVAWLIIRKLGQ